MQKTLLSALALVLFTAFHAMPAHAAIDCRPGVYCPGVPTPGNPNDPGLPGGGVPRPRPQPPQTERYFEGSLSVLSQSFCAKDVMEDALETVRERVVLKAAKYFGTHQIQRTSEWKYDVSCVKDSSGDSMRWNVKAGATFKKEN